MLYNCIEHAYIWVKDNNKLRNKIIQSMSC